MLDLNSRLQLAKQLNQPITIGNKQIANRLFLAPMAGLGHIALRRTLAQFGGYGLLFTGMFSAKAVPTENPLKSAVFSWRQEELPHLVGQIFGSEPKVMADAARRLEQEGFWGVDINMGCSVSAIVKRGCGAALLRQPQQALDIIKAVKDVVDFPVLVKMRSGWDSEYLASRNFENHLYPPSHYPADNYLTDNGDWTEASGNSEQNCSCPVGNDHTGKTNKQTNTRPEKTYLPPTTDLEPTIELALALQEAGVAAITFHPRTSPDRRTRPPNLNHLKIITKALSIPVFGNGNICTAADAQKMLAQTQCAGLSIGRMAIARPWLLHCLSTGKDEMENAENFLEQSAFSTLNAMFEYFEPNMADKLYRKYLLYLCGNFASGSRIYGQLTKGLFKNRSHCELAADIAHQLALAPQITRQPNMLLFNM